MNRIELPAPVETTDGQLWDAGLATQPPFTDRRVIVRYVRATRSWRIVIVGYTGLPSRYEERKTVSGARGLLGKLFNAQAVHPTGWERG